MADLLIRGMEMPRTCWDCVCVNGEFGYCQVNGQSICGFESKSSWCPLIEVEETKRIGVSGEWETIYQEARS